MSITIASTRPVRDPLLDNAKLAAIVLVVVGHTWTALRGVGVVDALYAFVYAFHVPVFVLLAGYVASARLTLSRAGWLAASLLAPYLLFELTYESLIGWVDGYHVHHNPWAPSWVMWFLISLLCWRLSVPVWQRLPAWLAVALSVTVSLLGGLTSADDLAVAKTLGLLPFFVIGLVAGPRLVSFVRDAPGASRWGSTTLGLGLLAASVLTLFEPSWFEIGWLRWRYSYAELGTSLLPGALVRLFVMAVALTLALAFLAVMPSRRTHVTSWGGNTLTTYLVHGAFVEAAVGFGLFDAGWSHSAVGVLVITAAAAALAVGLTVSATARVLRPVTDPVGYLRSSQIVTPGSRVRESVVLPVRSTR